ncbi:MAG TPA: zf-HC2 domain-containing protein [Thermoanaerobaculia bacterium]|nr:zf-HC2 domain-containing protein [Thermoanaerobaculia bacterium]
MTEPRGLERLREAFAQPEEPAHPERCPSVSEIWEGAHGRLPPDRLRDVVEHLASCSACAEAWRLAVLMERTAPGEEAADPRADQALAGDLVLDRRTSRPRWRLYAALAAAAAVAFAAVLGTYELRRGEAPAAVVQRGGSTADQAAATRWLSPGEAVLPRSNARLRWSGVPGATYDLTVDLEDESGAAKPIPIAAAHGLAATEYTVPVPDLARVPAGAPLHATLTAHLPDGRSDTISRDFRLR